MDALMNFALTFSLPVLLAAGFVWLASAASWMALPHHIGEYRPLKDEAAFAEALRRQSLRRGQYLLPHLDRWEDAATPAGRERFVTGPVAFLTILPNRVPSIRRHLLLTLAHYTVVCSAIAWATQTFVPLGASYHTVFPPVAVMALLAHGSALIPEAIWYGKPWSNVLRGLIDAVVFALLTAGAMAAMWPPAP